jgi:hypothetical protein
MNLNEGYFDAFSRLRVSDPTGLFSTQLQYDLDPLQMESGNTGSGTAPAHSANDRMATLAATGTGTSYMQSYQYFPYQPGKSQLIFITGVMGTATANIVKDYGYFDSANGIIFRQDGTNGLKFIRRTSTNGSVVNNEVAQADWNIDPLNGSGKSGITLDVADTFIFVIDLQFLAMGRVRCGFDIDGHIVYCHEFLNANNLSVPYMQTATLPIQALLTSSSGASGSMKFKCASVISEGGFQYEAGYSFATPSVNVTAGSGTRTHALSVRPNTTFASKTNRSLFVLNSLAILVTGNSPVFWELGVNATFSAEPTYTDVDATYSAFEYGTGGTYTAASGIIIASGYISASANAKGDEDKTILNRYPITLDRAGAVRNLGTLTLFVTGIGGTSATYSSINYTEIR